MAWTYIAQRAVTHEFLHWDLPLVRDDLSWELTGTGALRGSLAPDVGNLRDADGRLILEEWGTLLYAEEDGVIRWGGILISSHLDGERWSIEAASFTTYPHGTPYDGDFQAIGIDPVDAAIEIWRHVQSFPDADLGLTVVATPTPVRLGTPATDPAQGGMTNAAKYIADRMESGDEIGPNWAWAFNPQEVADWHDYLQGLWDRTVPAVDWLRAYVEAHPIVEAKPYTLLWSDNKDCGEEFATLAKTTPFDYVEVHNWSEDGETIEHRVFLAYPRTGRRREDLSFVQGDNVTEVVTPAFGGDDYANSVLGLGAGEGTAALRRQISERDGRLRRVAVFSDTTETDPARMDALIAGELAHRRGLMDIDAISVKNHPNAPIGSWELGDEVLVVAEIPWAGEIREWFRIVGWTLTGEHTASLSLARSDSFRYGG